MRNDTQEDAGDHCKEEVSIIPTTSSSRSDDDYPKIFIRSPSPPYKILKVAYHLSKKISDVKREVQAQLDLHPTAYTLQISRPWPKLLKDSCSLRDYNIHKETTIDIKLLRPITEPGVDQHGLLGGADVDTEVDTIPCTSSSSDLDDLSDGIPFGPYPSPLFYDEKNTKSATDTDGGEY